MSDVQAQDKPFAAGMYDYYLGGTANSAVDRAAAELAKKAMPDAIDAAWANRGFLQRAVKRLAEEFGIRQFIDIGAGLPTQRNTHEVVADVAADYRVVYVDHDPLVVARGATLLAGVENAAMVEADLRHPDELLDSPVTRRMIDFSKPVAVMMVAVTHFISDAD